MTDIEIIKALECCGNMNECKSECALGDLSGIEYCIHTLMLNALDLINRQQAEIERLKAKKRLYLERWGESLDWVKQERAESIKDFAERLKDRWTIASPEPYSTDAAEVLASINILAKEMTEDTYNG